MVPQNFLTLQSKKILTHDVWELIYIGDVSHIQPGQFLLCDCDSRDPRLRRSYSVSWVEEGRVYFIVKRIPDGKGGSIALCDQAAGHTMQVWGPMGHFTLQDTSTPKVFIGTGTGFAPLYFMIRHLLEQSKKQKEESKKEEFLFLFGVRELQDVFYQDRLEQWSREYPFFDYEIFLSRENIPDTEYNFGRVTDYLTPESVSELNSSGETEFYICGSPAMVTEVRSILELNGIAREKVFFEQY